MERGREGVGEGSGGVGEGWIEGSGRVDIVITTRSMLDSGVMPARIASDESLTG